MAAFAVIGGGEAGAFYVRQLLRAAAAGRLGVERIVVVDRDPRCAAAGLAPDARVTLAVSEWADWLDMSLDALPPGAHLVPYHWAPHLLREWLERQVRRHGGRAERRGTVPSQGVPWERELASGDRALSYATWVCPPTCIEPAMCPHTRGSKDWSLAGELARRRPDDESERVVFRALHLAYGVGTIPVSDILAARDRLMSGRGARRTYLVATASHCHGLAATLDVEGGSLDVAEAP
ncbi:MAG TPA: hypothetical protein VKA01_16270 [Vicinamibacteria bacterium]|nr:hypothetical protein [Vicinamibacteria bacterium]